MSERDNLKTRAYLFLRDQIITGRLEDGSQHSIYQVAQELGISRTPVREAVLQLANVGLVTIEKNRGFRICGASAKRLQDIFELRLLLEVPAAYRAAAVGGQRFKDLLSEALEGMKVALNESNPQSFRSQDRRFHDLIANASGNQQMCATLDSFHEVSIHPASNYGVRDSSEIIEEHARIADAISRGESAEAGAAMRSHLICTAEQLLARIAESSGEKTDLNWHDRFNMHLGLQA